MGRGSCDQELGNEISFFFFDIVIVGNAGLKDGYSMLNVSSHKPNRSLQPRFPETYVDSHFGPKIFGKISRNECEPGGNKTEKSATRKLNSSVRNLPSHNPEPYFFDYAGGNSCR